MTMLNKFLSIESLLLTAALGLGLGACDPKMIGSETKGDVVCTDGEKMLAEDGCNDCTCVDGAWACTEKACGEPEPGMCVDGEVKPSGDGCNDCTCYNDAWACTKKACEEPQCQPGEVKQDACNSCECVEGGWACTEMGCVNVCGDGVVGGDETCDDGNQINDDGCPNDCGVDGETDTGQTETDTGDTDTDTGGTGVCGDGLVEGAEACDDGNQVDDDGCPNDCGIGGGACLPDDPLEINSAAIVGDTLEVEVSYGGGCEDHVIEMCWDGSFAESLPVQTWVALSHDGNDDLCDAWLTMMRSIDLTGMRTAYQEGYQTQNGTIIIHLDGWPSALDYTF